MGVYINMEMPKSCAFCRFYGAYCYAKGDEDVHSTLPCPLVPVPPHGDLVDVDELLKKKWSVLWNGESFYVVNADDLIEAPTIVEEENGV